MKFHGDAIIELFLVIVYVTEDAVFILVVVFNDGKVCKCHFFTGYPFSVCFDEGRVSSCGFQAFG